MDSNRFDDVARLVATGTSRRRVLGFVLGGLVTALTRADRARAQTCHALGEGCDLGDPCCDGLVCTAGLVCAETCGAVDGPCASAGDCCQELACSPSGTCYDPNCRGEGASCDPPGSEGTHQLCCPGFYCHPAGRCVTDDTSSCAVSGDPCPNGDECCDGLGCHPQFHECIERGGGFLCIDDSDCGADHTCDPTGRCRLAPGTCSEQGGPCATHFECCGLLQCQDFGDGSGFCGDGICGSADAYCGDAPLGAIPCCDGYRCVADECVACAAEGESCGEPSACCAGLTCSDSNVCIAETGACAGEGADCAVDGDCCAGICCGGTCHTLACCPEDDDPSARCPDGEVCVEGVCVATGSCATEGKACGASSDCCGASTCRDGFCVPPIEDGASDAPEPDEGTSDATQLPATGTGRKNGGSDAVLLGLAASAAAVAAVAARRARSSEHE